MGVPDRFPERSVVRRGNARPLVAGRAVSVVVVVTVVEGRHERREASMRRFGFRAARVEKGCGRSEQAANQRDKHQRRHEPVGPLSGA